MTYFLRGCAAARGAAPLCFRDRLARKVRDLPHIGRHSRKIERLIISWDEALDLVVSKFKELQSNPFRVRPVISWPVIPG
jgi:hypothetical protein